MDFNQSPIENGLIWITGYSGAGKTTIAKIVSENLRELGVPVVLLDGDDLRSILGERFGHDLDSRRHLSYVYSRLCQKVAECGVTVVIATVAMFESVRLENRASNDKYLEVYLEVPLSIRAERDPKGLYKSAMAVPLKEHSLSAGLEEPVNPDLVISNYGEMSPQIAASMIVQGYLDPGLKKPKPMDVEFNSDSDGGIERSRIGYWDSYYSKRKAPISPSSFALFCNENYLEKNSHILEFGCGNGRDSFFFSKTHRVTAIDESRVVIDTIRARAFNEGLLNLDFLHGAFGREISGLPFEVDAIYGRFVIHAMSEDAETMVLQEAWRLLKVGGHLFLEFRTTQDPLMSMGTMVGKTERVTDHYRRFVDFKQFCEKLSGLGFGLKFAIEKRGLATYGSDDPVVGRIVAIKNSI